MNILYLSHLSGNLYAGPTYSVPKQIEYQSKIDNVFWYNAVKRDIDKWKSYDYYHDLSDYPNETIRDLPAPFNDPDIIVIELFYHMARSPLLHELINSKIPYVIIPRGELTKQAQRRKRLKKLIANTLILNKYSRNASAIQYLTKQEYLDSGERWNKNHIIIPNGIEIRKNTAKKNLGNSIKCVNIGRIEPYQKGLDMLIEACSTIKDQLKTANCTIDIYGPDVENKLQFLNAEVLRYGLESIIKFHDGVYGKEKEEILKNSDVFLMTSRFEGHPMALIEALSFGLPVIATKGSNMIDEISEYDAGRNAENNTLSIRNAILKMLAEDNRCSKSENSLKLSMKYTWDILAEKSRLEYSKIIYS